MNKTKPNLDTAKPRVRQLARHIEQRDAVHVTRRCGNVTAFVEASDEKVVKMKPEPWHEISEAVSCWPGL